MLRVVQLKMTIVVTFGLFMALFMVIHVKKGSEFYVDDAEKSKFVDLHLVPKNNSWSKGVKSKDRDYNSTTDEYFFIYSREQVKNKKPERTTRANLYTNRRKYLREACNAKYGPDRMLKVKPSKLDHILIDEKHKILFCYIPKVACTNWKRIFMILTGKGNNITQVFNLPSSELHARNLFFTLQNYTAAEASDILESYKKIIFVRNPFERLLSAYRNKLEQHYDSSKYFQARFGKYIIKNFRKNASNEALEKGDDVTFSEFAQYLISTSPSSFNEHWQVMNDLCFPCFLDYDFIGKYETFIDDSNYVLKKYLSVNFTFPMLQKPSQTAPSLKKYFSQLTKNVIYELYKIYEVDFKLFKYNLEEMLSTSNV